LRVSVACPRRDAGAVVVVGRHARSELAMSALCLIVLQNSG
jgi:hypothetical protein